MQPVPREKATEVRTNKNGKRHTSDNGTCEEDIEKDFQDGFAGIKQLPKGSRFGVYVAYIYYYNLFDKIKKIHASRIMEERIRISDRRKYSLFMTSYIRNQIGFL